MENVEEKNNEQQKSKIKSFWINLKNNLMKTTNGMAIGLFGTLIIGTIIDLFAKIPALEFISNFTAIIKGLMGAGIGLGVALSLKKNPITTVTIMAAGMAGNSAFHFTDSGIEFVKSLGDPLSCYVSAIICLLAIKYIMRKPTPVDLILIPLVGLTFSFIYVFLASYYVHYVTIGLSELIRISFDVIPFIMCIIISTLVGMALTAPISSVAICVAISIGNVPLASTAALIGCCTQMLGFAVHTARDNKWGSVLAVGIGTSMLQFKNIIRKPLIWVPTIVVSAILGPFALILVNGVQSIDASLVSTLSVGAGMGTSGLVGPINFLSVYNFNWVVILELVGFCVVLPIALVFVVDLIFRKLGWFKEGDFSLEN